MSTLTIGGEKHEVNDEVANLVLLISKERDELKDLAIWMTGCGYDFCQHDYFCQKRDELLKSDVPTVGDEPE
jgi:hypothetical protein